ncbi:Kinase superfamily protein isoform 1 [Hibiscus syriacus]|uniref:Kinase superfamily protein isoform 1 n=2 Tax=Hibiscus syriacus TaxID=106335 RepID=A0A6A3AH87_HIBSY|nr:Kinase superfamily protein isoform 1 [Hibiscus syriacus]
MSQLQQEKQQRKTSASVSRASTLLRSTSQKGTSETENRSTSTSRKGTSETKHRSRSASRKGTSETENRSRSTSRSRPTPLVFSQSMTRRKPQPVEKTLECTLEELCFGAVKRINIVKDVISEEGIIVRQEDTQTIKIKPGWTKGTKVIFEGKGDEKPGYLPADIKFTIQEQRHHLFKRTGDDLEIVVEIPLVKALTGCHLAVPLLGGETMSIYVSDIVYPGYLKVIQGQGMPKAKEGNRGDLRITFLVKFPLSLTDKQRSEACSILEGCSC